MRYLTLCATLSVILLTLSALLISVEIDVLIGALGLLMIVLGIAIIVKSSQELYKILVVNKRKNSSLTR